MFETGTWLQIRLVFPLVLFPPQFLFYDHCNGCEDLNNITCCSWLVVYSRHGCAGAEELWAVQGV